MADPLLPHLEFLYGAGPAAQTLPRLRELMTRRAPAASPARRDALPLTECDALLITYGDQVRDPDTSPLRTLGAFAHRHLRDLLSGIHILPFYPYSSDDGFSVIDYFAVDPALGAWADVESLARSFDLMFDAVFNHISAQSEWFRKFLKDDAKFRDFFITVEGEPDLAQVVRPRALPLLTAFDTASGRRKVWTTFSADQIDVNARNPEVLLALVDALLFYVAKGARFIRLDAIAYLWKEIGTPCIHLPQTHRIIQLMRAVLDEVAPHALLITETNVPHADNLSYFGDGSNEAQLVYNFALPPLVLHSLLTGNGAALTRWAASLQLPSDRVAFFNFLASHDGIGVNPARGILTPSEIDHLVATTLAHGGLIGYKHNPDGSKSPYELNITYFDALSDPRAREPLDTQIDRFMVAQAIMLALAGMPGIYFHSLFGSRNDRAAADASGIPRRINRQKFPRTELERELADPGSLRAKVFARFGNLLARRRQCAAFHPAAPQQVLDCDERVFALLRTSRDGRHRALCLHNLTNEPVSVTIPLAGEAAGTVRKQLGPYEVAWTADQDPDSDPAEAGEARGARIGAVTAARSRPGRS